MAMDKFEITILESSDVHGYVYPINYADNSNKPGGFARLSTIIKEEREKNKNLILLDNGDVLQGTPLTYHYVNIENEKVNPLIKVMNQLKYDGAVIGNHEFNYGKAMLSRAIEDSDFPWLSCNILDSSTGEPYFGEPYIIKEFENGVKVAIIGCITKYVPNWENEKNIEAMEFQDVIDHLNKWVKFLKEEKKVDVIVVGYHGGYERNLYNDSQESTTGENQAFEICEKVPYIDVLLTGHQHRIVETKIINGVLTVQPGAEGEAMAKINLSLVKKQGAWKVIDKSSKLLYAKDVEEDKEILSLIEDYEKATQRWLDKPIGYVQGDMSIKDPMAIRLKDNAFIEFINRVQMEVSGANISATSLFDNEAKGFKENITMRDIVSNYIYPNTLKVIRVKGKDIKAALERSASYFGIHKGNIKVSKDFTHTKIQHYNYDMWEGINYKLDISKPIGHRVVKIDYDNKPLDMDKEYDVVMNNYRASGGGEYDMFKNKQVVKEINIDMAELIANYILDKKVIKAECNKNWEVV